MPERRQARFRTLEEASLEEWRLIDEAEREHRRAGRGGGLMRLLATIDRDDPLGAPLNVFAHSLQTATRVLRDGGDDELVVVALFHDLPEAFSDNRHGLLAAELLAPWLSERRRWILIHHEDFQAYHYRNHPTCDRFARDRYRGHPYFEDTVAFCARYDQVAFDINYPTLPLDEFAPIVTRFFARERPPLPPLPD